MIFFIMGLAFRKKFILKYSQFYKFFLLSTTIDTKVDKSTLHIKTS